MLSSIWTEGQRTNEATRGMFAGRAQESNRSPPKERAKTRAWCLERELVEGWTVSTFCSFHKQVLLTPHRTLLGTMTRGEDAVGLPCCRCRSLASAATLPASVQGAEPSAVPGTHIADGSSEHLCQNSDITLQARVVPHPSPWKKGQ